MKLSSSSPSSPSSACTPSFPTRTSRGCRRRRVSFSLTEAKSKCNNVSSSSSSSSSCCNNTQNQKDDCCDPSQCWYTESELEAIKMEIRQCACRLFHSGHYRPGDVTFQSEPSQEAATTAANEKDASSLSATTTTTTASAFVCWRGLELKLSPERQQNRLLTIRAIVKAQSRFQNPDMLAFVAHKCSMWANQIAVQAANRDYHDVYEKKTGDGAAAVVESDKEEKEEDENPLALPVVDAPNLLRTFRKRILYHQQHQEQRQQQDDDDDDQNQRRVRQCTRPEVFV